MIHVIAIITAKPGNRDAILEAFRANMPAVHAEAGCIEYGPAIDTEGAGRIQTAFGPDTFVVLEKWEKSGPFEGAWRLRSHGRLRGKNKRPDRQPRHPRSVARRLKQVTPFGLGRTAIVSSTTLLKNNPESPVVDSTDFTTQTAPAMPAFASASEASRS